MIKSKNCKPGYDQHEFFQNPVLNKEMVQYDYRLN